MTTEYIGKAYRVTVALADYINTHYQDIRCKPGEVVVVTEVLDDGRAWVARGWDITPMLVPIAMLGDETDDNN